MLGGLLQTLPRIEVMMGFFKRLFGYDDDDDSSDDSASSADKPKFERVNTNLTDAEAAAKRQLDEIKRRQNPPKVDPPNFGG